MIVERLIISKNTIMWYNAERFLYTKCSVGAELGFFPSCFVFLHDHFSKGEILVEEKRSSFSGSIGFVLAAAGSAIGLGNLWRFPYLAAKNGGGLFLVVYLALLMTFGFTLLITEVAIGRKTKRSPLMAYEKMHKK